MNMRRTRRVTGRWAGVIAFALIVAACGGSDNAGGTTSTQPTGAAAGSSTAGLQTTVTTTAPPSTAPQGGPAPQLAGTEWNVTDYSQGSNYTNVWKTEITILRYRWVQHV
jgi:ABC-type glycerol-3-phosphate transport system substrate-binding protein